jgi:hypothetical protein
MKSIARYWVAAVVGIALTAGCDMGLEQSSNRYEQLNMETKKLTEILRQISDEASAKAHESELEEVGDEMRDIQERITASAEKKAKEGSGPGLGGVANYRQASLWEQSGDAARRQVERIREADPKASAIVDKALEGVQFPEPPPEMPAEL